MSVEQQEEGEWKENSEREGNDGWDSGCCSLRGHWWWRAQDNATSEEQLPHSALRWV